MKRKKTVKKQKTKTLVGQNLKSNVYAKIKFRITILFMNSWGFFHISLRCITTEGATFKKFFYSNSCHWPQQLQERNCGISLAGLQSTWSERTMCLCHKTNPNPLFMQLFQIINNQNQSGPALWNVNLAKNALREG